MDLSRSKLKSLPRFRRLGLYCLRLKTWSLPDRFSSALTSQSLSDYSRHVENSRVHKKQTKVDHPDHSCRPLPDHAIMYALGRVDLIGMHAVGNWTQNPTKFTLTFARGRHLLESYFVSYAVGCLWHIFPTPSIQPQISQCSPLTFCTASLKFVRREPRLRANYSCKSFPLRPNA